jgi:hypothetical protein
MREPTAVERVSGNLLTKAGLTLIATASGTPLSALLPLLSESLAGRRHSARIEKSLEDVHSILKEHEEALQQLTDPQYKLLNEVVLSIMQSTEDGKLKYLRRAIKRGLEAPEIDHTVAAQASRALRDMTAGELGFVIAHSQQTIMVGPVTGNLADDTHVVDRYSEEISYVSGLLGLGILVPAGSTMDDGGRYVFPPFVRQLRDLIRGAA